jgi:hypothetical protein
MRIRIKRWGSLSLVRTIEELLERKISGPDLENQGCSRRDTSRWPHGTLSPQKLALTSSTSDSRSVGVVRSRAQAAEFNIHKSNCTISYRTVKIIFLSFWYGEINHDSANTIVIRLWGRFDSRQTKRIYLCHRVHTTHGYHPPHWGVKQNANSHALPTQTWLAHSSAGVGVWTHSDWESVAHLKRKLRLLTACNSFP